MIGFLRLLVFGFLALSVLYVLLGIYMRSLARESLEEDWAEEHPGDQDSPAREAFVEEGMAAYKRGIRPKLLILVYLIPALIAVATLYIMNFV